MILYRVVWRALFVVTRLFWRLRIDGRENVPATGAFVLAPVHRSFIDFGLTCQVTRRRIRYMGKDSLWKVPGLRWLISALGAYPVHRGGADREALRRTVEVLEGVCSYYNVDLERMRGKQREREIVWPRQVAMYLMRQETTASLLQIGAELGGRDHTTIMHGWEKVQTEITNNDRVRREVAAVLESLQRGKP